MAGYVNGKIEIWCGDYAPYNLNILWYKRISLSPGVFSYELLDYDNVSNTWSPIQVTAADSIRGILAGSNNVTIDNTDPNFPVISVDESIGEAPIDTFQYTRQDGGWVKVLIPTGLTLGETYTTAYRGDRGKIAYNHSQTDHAPSNAEENIIIGLQKNGIDLIPDSNRKVNVTVPTQPSDIGAATSSQGAKADTALQSFTETDPTVPSWAKTESKPTYTANEIGAEPAKGDDDNYVTDAEKIVIGNTSGTNTGDQNLSGYSQTSHRHSGETITPEAIDFDLTPSTDPNTVGRLQWNADEKTLQFGVEGGSIDVNKEIFDYYIDTNDNLIEGNVVSVTGISGNRQAVTKTNNIDRASATACIGMVTNKNADDTVRVTKKGRVRKLNTAGMTEGLPVYANSTGGFTQTSPTAPNYFIHLGVVEVAHAVNGIIDIDVQIVYNLDDASNVDGTDTEILDTDVVIKKDTAGLWKKVTWANVKVLLNVIYGRLTTINTWALLQTFTSGLKTTKIIPNSDTTGVVIRNAADTADLFKIDSNGFQLDQYDDVMPGMGWVDAVGGATPDITSHTIAGIAVNYKSFDGGNTTEAMTNAFEITHAIDVDALNRVSAPLLAEMHTHGMAATTGAGVVKIFYDLVYHPVNAAPITWGTFSNLVTINANEQYWHKLAGAELTAPTGGYHIGDKITCKYYRNPQDAQDTYAGDWLFMQCAMHMPLNSNGSRTRYTK